MEFTEVMRRLFSKKAALYMILLDCCNGLTPILSKNYQLTDRTAKFELQQFHNQIKLCFIGFYFTYALLNLIDKPLLVFS